ncbi:hypothetical protein, partial [Pseudonocardia acaciae]|uniref:hypothetical protein n=1 Tax=Pseudonocardia acaciae TaxID=551276 RepID=UPI003CCBB857
MGDAEHHHGVDGGAASVGPVHDVMDLASVGLGVTARVGAAAVSCGESVALWFGGGALCAADVEDFAVAAEYDWDDAGVAEQSSEVAGADVPAVVQ